MQRQTPNVVKSGDDLRRLTDTPEDSLHVSVGGFLFQRKHEALLFERRNPLVGIIVGRSTKFAEEDSFYKKLFEHRGVEILELKRSSLRVK